MNRTITRRCRTPLVAAVVAALLSPVSATAASDPVLPHGLIRTEVHTQVQEVMPVGTAALTQVQPMAARQLNYTQQVQQYDQWCWAATGSSIERTLGGTADQRTFCAAGKGTSAAYCPNQAAQIYEIVRGFRGTGFNAQDAGGRISFASIQRQIDAGIPNLTGIYWTSGGGHAEVIYGYDSTNQTILVGDPWPTYQRYQTWGYTQYTSNSRFRWNDTIVNISRAF